MLAAMSFLSWYDSNVNLLYSTIDRSPKNINCDNMCQYRAIIGEVDEDHDSQVDLSQIRAPPLKPVTH